jgi:hypothetical protein
MTKSIPTVAAQHRIVLPAVAVAVAGILLSACSDFKRVVGIEKTPPDEFAVEQRAPLTIPPDFNLRPPQPGAGRPQEMTSADRARRAIDSAGPGEPGKQASGSLKYPGGEPQLNTEAQVADQSIAQKLLETTDTGASVIVEKRETSTLKDVY